jgi:hypothetical protein
MATTPIIGQRLMPVFTTGLVTKGYGIPGAGECLQSFMGSRRGVL